MKEIRKDLSILELECTEYIEYFFIILKKNFSNFLLTIVLLLLLNIVLVYQSDLASYITYSSLGNKIYEIFKIFGQEKIIDEGLVDILGEEIIKFGLYLRIKVFLYYLYYFFSIILYIGITISICKYIEKESKIAPLFEIIKSFFRILKLIPIILIFILICLKIETVSNVFIKIIMEGFISFVLLKSIFVIQEYCYQKHSLLYSIKKSFDYINFNSKIIGIGIILILLNQILFLRIPIVISILINIISQLIFAISISLAYLNRKYLDNKGA